MAHFDRGLDPLSVSQDDVLAQVMAPRAMPLPDYIETETGMILPPEHTVDRLRHFAEEVYDLGAESHLARLMKVLLGDASVGGLRKRFLTTRLQATLQGSHFHDLDRFYGALFGVHRRTYEMLDSNPYTSVHTPDEWREQHAKDSSYRSRIYQFARAIGFGGSPIGLELVAEALLQVDCEIYETYVLDDQGLENFGITGTNRREFVVRPKREITLEEAYDVSRVIQRLKPTETMFSVDTAGVALSVDAPIRSLYADSEYWEIQTEVYVTSLIDPDPEPEPPRTPPFCSYQGEAWSYNSDVMSSGAYVTDAEGNWLEFEASSGIGSEGVSAAQDALAPHKLLMAGRSVSDGILVTSPYAEDRVGAG